MNDWAHRCPQCGYEEDGTPPGHKPGPNRCPECGWPMNTIDRDVAYAEN